MMLVPPQVAREASTATLLRHAVRQVPAEETSTLDDVVRVPARAWATTTPQELGNLLLDTAEMPLAHAVLRLAAAGHCSATDAALTVITMAGLRLPDLKIEREYWSAEEALALPMLHTAHRLAVRRCYGGSRCPRKLVGLDEAHFMEGWRSGRSFLVRLARDSRKWNLAALVASQNPRDILGLDVQNLVSTVFVGRIAEDAEIAAEALRLLRVPDRRRVRGRRSPRCPRWTPSSSARLGLPRVRHARRRRAGAEGPRRRVVRRRICSTYLDTTPARRSTRCWSAARTRCARPASRQRRPRTRRWRRDAGRVRRGDRCWPRCRGWRLATLFGGAGAGGRRSRAATRAGARRPVLDRASGATRPTSGACVDRLQDVSERPGAVPQGADAQRARLRHGRLVRHAGRDVRKRAAARACTASTATPATATRRTTSACASDADASGLQVRKHRGQRRVHARDVGHRRLQRAARARLGPGVDVGLGRPAGRDRPPRPSTTRSSRVFGVVTLASSASTCSGGRGRPT